MAARLRTAGAATILPLLLLLALPASLQAQFSYWSDGTTITINGYTGSGGAVAIPSVIDSLPVTRIGDETFQECTNLTSVTIPDSVTSVGVAAFFGCARLTSVTIGNGVTSLGDEAFEYCTSLTSVTMGHGLTRLGSEAFEYCNSLTSVTIPNSVTSIADSAFYGCASLTSVTIGNGATSIGYQMFYGCTNLASLTIGNSVTRLGDYAFWNCTNLASVYFTGNAPSVGSDVFYGVTLTNVVVCYLPGTTGWGATFHGIPTVLWNPQVQTSDASFGIRTNRFGFTITGTTNLVIVVEACVNLAHRAWVPVGTVTLAGGSSYFSDPHWTNFPARFYRLRSP